MKLFVRVAKIPGPVLEIYRGNDLFPMTNELRRTWYEATGEVEEGWIFDGKKFNAPKPVINRTQAPVANAVQEGLDALQEKADNIQKEIKKSIDVVAQAKVNNDSLKLSLKDIYEGLVACKGFLMMIPDLQAEIAEIKAILKNQQNKGTK